MFGFLRRKKRDDYHQKMNEDTRQPPEQDSIQLEGLELESAVRKEVFGNNPNWDSNQLQALLLALETQGFTVVLQSFESGGWQCIARLGNIYPGEQQIVMERARHSPAAAVMKAALAAFRYWPQR